MVNIFVNSLDEVLRPAENGKGISRGVGLSRNDDKLLLHVAAAQPVTSRKQTHNEMLLLPVASRKSLTPAIRTSRKNGCHAVCCEFRKHIF